MESGQVQEVIEQSPSLEAAIQAAVEADIPRFTWGGYRVYLKIEDGLLRGVRLSRILERREGAE